MKEQKRMRKRMIDITAVCLIPIVCIWMKNSYEHYTAEQISIFIGSMFLLINGCLFLKERDKYGANDVRPGLTGWAQIHGRDELEIDVKAKLDGYYVQHMSFWMDVKCFFGTIASVIRSEGVVEGGTGTIHAKEKQDGKK